MRKMKKKVILDAGVITNLVGKKTSEKMKLLLGEFSDEGDLQGYVTKPILLEVAKHLSFLYRREKVTSIIFSFLQTLKIIVIEPDVNTYIRAGRLQYSNSKILSACDALTITLGQKKDEKYRKFTTDGKMIKETRNIKESVKYRIFRYS